FAILTFALLAPCLRAQNAPPSPAPQNPPLVSPSAAPRAVAPAGGAKVQAVEFRGNRRVPAATLRARIFTQPGDAYDEAALHRDFMALYNTGLFDDIVL